MFQVRKFVAPEMILGSNVRLLSGNYFYNLGISKILIVTDQNLLKLPWFKDILVQLDLDGINYEIFSKISPNSPDYEVMEGASYYSETHSEAILAIGGGSVLDSSKGIGIVHSNGNHILSYEGVDKIGFPCPPIVCIPTTSGTSSDVSQFSIIRNTERKIKIAVISKSLVPDLALIDPVVTETMDSYLTACTGLDALTHAIEAFVSNGNSPVTDLHALNSIRLINENLLNSFKFPENQTYRYNMMIASLEAGLAFSNASLGAVHALAHSLGGYYNLPHGECNALLLNHVCNANFEVEENRFRMISEALGNNHKVSSTLETKKRLFHQIEELKHQMGIDYSFSKLGVKSDDISLLAKNAFQDPCLITNPKNLTVDDLKFILSESL